MGWATNNSTTRYPPRDDGGGGDLRIIGVDEFVFQFIYVLVKLRAKSHIYQSINNTFEPINTGSRQ